MRKLLIDGDIICYQMGFSADKRGLTEQGALDYVKTFIHDMVEYLGADDFDIYLTGADNFRIEVAKTAPYKGQRSGDRPTHYQAIRDYLIEKLEAEVVDGEEADDALGKNQTKDTVLCSTDKDLDQIPGLHYNWRKNQVYEITKEYGRMFFLKQMLTGDTADNIIGIKGVGVKKAEKALKGLSYQEGLAKVREMYESAFGDAAESRLKENAQLLWIRR